MIIVRFPDETTKRKAIEFLIGRFNGHTWATGEMAVPEEALGAMARAGVTFTVEGPATYDRIQGIWHQGGIEFRDQLNRVFVDAPDTPENRRFFTDLKQRLKARFEQLDIWLTVHPIEIL